MKESQIAVSHFTNSALSKPGSYSCAVDCFLEISTHLFLPFLSKLTVRSEFPELLFSALSHYCQFSGNKEFLADIREPVWLYLIEKCASFRQRDCNACFSQIFEENTFGKLTAMELSLFATQRLFESYCITCQKQVTLNSRIYFIRP